MQRKTKTYWYVFLKKVNLTYYFLNILEETYVIFLDDY